MTEYFRKQRTENRKQMTDEGLENRGQKTENR
jgi:hypothetical protein